MKARPPAQRERALQLLPQVGPAQTAALLDLPRNTVKSWGANAGISHATATRECALPGCTVRFALRTGKRFCTDAHRALNPSCPTCGAPSRRAGRYCTPCGRARENERTLRKYGLTEESYTTLLEAQHGVCVICCRPETARARDGSVRRLVVDHDHTTGAVRGLLCSRCNVALGMLDDNTARLAAAISYLERNA